MDEVEDKIVSICKIESKLETKEQAVKEIIKRNKPCDHKLEVVSTSTKGGAIKIIIQRCIKCGFIRTDKIYYPSGSIDTKFSKV